MTKTFIDASVYQKMDNKTLIQKQMDIEVKISKLMGMRDVPADLFDDCKTIQTLIDNEIDTRLDNGTMDMDELEDDF